MLAIFNVTVPFFALVLCGYLAARGRRLPLAAVGPLNSFVLYFALPALLFRFVANSPFRQIANAPIFLAYGCAGMLVFVLCAVLLRRFNREGWRDAAFGALAASWANWGYMGFALIPAILGEEAIGLVVAAGIADLVLVVSAALALASCEGRGGEHWTRAVKGALQGIGRNPLIWAIIAGLCTSAFGLKLPFAIDEFLRLLATAAGPVALFAIGVSLYLPGPLRLAPATCLIVAIKLVLHPVLAWAVATSVLGLTQREAAVLMLMAALPAAGTVFLFAEQQQADAERIAAVIMLSTALAFGSFSVFAALVR
ncbi:MAG: AEC family transporter [Lautropia sp.]|nr:AEC family transporter [Lautropia sp.]